MIPVRDEVKHSLLTEAIMDTHEQCDQFVLILANKYISSEVQRVVLGPISSNGVCNVIWGQIFTTVRGVET